jgi:DNA-binding transcriptional regulator PaaX
MNKRAIRNQQAKDILKAAALIGFVLFLGVAAPNAAGHILKLLGMVPDRRSKDRVKKSIQSLEKRGLMKIRKGKNNYYYFEVTEKGKAYWLTSNIAEFKLKTHSKWDRNWRIITFDIPEEKAEFRRRFSSALNLIGMYKLEKSVYIFPFECREVVYKIAKAYKIDRYIRYILASEVENDEQTKKFFKL